MWTLLKSPRVWLAILAVSAVAAVALWPTAVDVETAIVETTPLVVTLDEEGETRVRDRFVVSAPVSGRVLRLEVEPGDVVRIGQVLTRVRPESPPLLDARALAEARAASDAAQAGLGQAEARAQQARDELAHATRERARVQSLFDAGLSTRQELDARDTAERAATEAADAAMHGVEVATSEARRAAARLEAPRSGRGLASVPVTSPVAGVVLKRLRQSESLVPGGEPLVEIGDPRSLEIVSDLLSTDAVQVAPGARVLIEGWGGAQPLDGVVRRIEPAGFTKVSALGVEEQRVNVVCDLRGVPEAWAALGDAYRAEVRIVVWEASRVLTVPTSALFRVGEGWAAFVAHEGRVHRRAVRIGHRTSQRAEVLEGLAEGESVVVYPSTTVRDGVRARTRPS